MLRGKKAFKDNFKAAFSLAKSQDSGRAGFDFEYLADVINIVSDNYTFEGSENKVEGCKIYVKYCSDGSVFSTTLEFPNGARTPWYLD